MTSWTASCASSGPSTGHVTYAVAAGTGCSRNAASTMSPRVPYEPQKRRPRSYPATFLTTLPPERAIRPSARTIVSPMIRSRGVPYRVLSGPDAPVAIVPPTVEPGRGTSRARRWPCSASRSASLSIGIPASAFATRSPAACSMRPSSRWVSTSRSHRRGGVPQSRRVSAPRGTTARPCSAATRMTSAASATFFGAATIAGSTPSTPSAGSPGRTSPQTFAKASSGCIRRGPPFPRRGGGPCGHRAPRRTGGAWGTPCRGCTAPRGRSRSAPSAWCRGPCR